jgi:catechol 2,3-dioxygenase-like lactoylglutathione lyase family enzyme
MKRLHIHIGIENLEEAIRFYTTLFGAAPVKTKSDYAKWLLDDPLVNFAVSTRASKHGVDHLGIQVDDVSELADMRNRLKQGELSVFDEGETVCCYARSDKTWVQDPSGVPWEAYHTMEDAEVISNRIPESKEACCTPETKGQPECCAPSATTMACCAA